MGHRWKGAVPRGERCKSHDTRWSVYSIWITDGRFPARELRAPRYKREYLQPIDHRWKGAVPRGRDVRTTV